MGRKLQLAFVWPQGTKYGAKYFYMYFLLNSFNNLTNKYDRDPRHQRKSRVYSKSCKPFFFFSSKEKKPILFPQGNLTRLHCATANNYLQLLPEFHRPQVRRILSAHKSLALKMARGAKKRCSSRKKNDESGTPNKCCKGRVHWEKLCSQDP